MAVIVFDNGNGTNIVSDDLNWVGDTKPGSSDIGTFNSTSTADCAIDENIDWLGINIESTYSGTITQNATFTITIGSSSWTQAAGTFVGGDSLIRIDNGSFTQSGGTFTNSSGNMEIDRNFTRTSGTFNNSATVTFTGAGGSQNTTVDFDGSFPGTVDINKTNATASFTVASGTTISLGASPNTNCNAGFTNNGTITIASGTWTHTGVSGFGGVIQNNGTITHSGTGWVMVHSGITNAVGATITYSGTTISLDRDFDQGGTFDTTGMTITFTGTNNSDNSTITFAGTLAAVMVFNKTNLTSDITVASGTTIGLGVGPTSNVGNIMTNNGTINIPSGTWNYNAMNSGSSFVNNGTIAHSGDGWVISNCGITNNSGATITYAGTDISMDDDFTDDGTFDTTGITITFVGTQAGDDTSFFQTSQVFEGNIVLNKTNVTSNFVLGSNVTIQGNFTRTDGIVQNPASAFTLTVEGNFSMSTTDAFGGANLTLKMAGSNDQTFTQNAGTLSCELVWDKSGGTLTQTTAVTNATDRDMTGNNGHWCNNGFDLTIDDELTIDPSATLTEIIGSTISFGSKTGVIRSSDTCVLPVVAGGGRLLVTQVI